MILETEINCQGKKRPGAPEGNRNARTHGKYCAEAQREREQVGQLIRLLVATAELPEDDKRNTLEGWKPFLSGAKQ